MYLTYMYKSSVLSTTASRPAVLIQNQIGGEGQAVPGLNRILTYFKYIVSRVDACCYLILNFRTIHELSPNK